ncbi:MAG TPA: 3-methyl-2-oxobutanoate hydroxymethyltransferase [Methylovirgula sp.]|nr:3-methyl-2-oxobutanoate hydroxymethyltransferase [Methylovirgula sp.]
MHRAARFFEMKRLGQPIAVLTAYDYPTAKAEAEAGIDLILVGDSLGTNVLGYASERQVTLADIAHHLRAVRRGAPQTPILADLPFGQYETPAAAIVNARELVEAGADMVKFEGARPEIVAALKEAGILCCGHLGLEPQHHEDRRLKGRSVEEAKKLLADAIALDKAGISLLVLELVPEEVAEQITRALGVPTIGIGAGRLTDGQVLVINDVLGITQADFRHSRRFADFGRLTGEALKGYIGEVRERRFPAGENVFHMGDDELRAFGGRS